MKRGFIAKDSVLDKILQQKDAPPLPGIPVYLPHEWTIKATQRMLYDFLVIWKEECRGDKKKVEDLNEFFKLVIREFRAQVKKFDGEVEEMSSFIKIMKNVPLLKDAFSPVYRRDNTMAIQRFFLDSFSVGIAVKNTQSVSEFANWFLDWTQDLYALWTRPNRRKYLKRV